MITSSNSAVNNTVQGAPKMSMANNLIAKLRVLKWLILREFWEYKISYLIGACIASICALSLSGFYNIKILASKNYDELVERSYGGEFQGFFIVSLIGAAFAAYYHLSHSLYADRQDKSILFWKSFPVSDSQVVASKLIFPLLLAPAFAFLVSCCLFLIDRLQISAIFWYKAGAEPLELHRIYNAWYEPVRELRWLPTYLLWALPTVGWIAFVSAWTKWRVFPMAVGLPWLIELMVYLVSKIFNTSMYIDNLFTNALYRITGGLIPGMWWLAEYVLLPLDQRENRLRLSEIKKMAFSELTQPWTWYAALFGLIMIMLAIRQRRYADVI
jgi:ABC-2 type transport system permease protein